MQYKRSKQRPVLTNAQTLRTYWVINTFGGVILTLIAYFVAGSQNSGNVAIDSLEHNEHIILAIFGVALSISGASSTFALASVDS